MDDTPPSIDPYAVLGLETEATGDDVKRSYRKLALKHHPDKSQESDKEAAKKKFQEIAFAYAVLSDEHRRKRYDLTGSTAETLDDDQDFDWLSFYREQFDDLVTQDSIQKISHNYKDSAEERKDLLEAYTRGKGKFNYIYDNVMLSDILEDDDRFRKILDEEIENDNIEVFPAYRKETDATREKAKAIERKRRDDFDKKHGTDAADKAKAKQKGKKGGASDMSDLAALIQQRQKARNGNFFESLEAKYAPKSRGKKRATPMDEDEPSEEAFQAARAKLDKSKTQKNGRATKKKKVESEDEEESEAIATDSDDSEEEEEEEEETPPPKPKKRAKVSKPRSRAKAKA